MAGAGGTASESVIGLTIVSIFSRPIAIPGADFASERFGAFAGADTEGAGPRVVGFPGAEMHRLLAAEAAFEFVNAGVLNRIDASEFVPAAAAFLQPLHRAPLKQIGALE